MIVLDPVTFGDVTCTRAAPASYFDRNGAQQTAAPNTLRVTYDQADLGKAPYALLDAGEVIGSGAGLVYSNVPIPESVYSATSTYAKDALVYDPASHSVFQSLIANNIGKAMTDTSAWTPRGVTNRWKMLDEYNNTQTEMPDEILIVLAPETISQGLYLGNVFADEVRISVVDPTEGIVYSETTELVQSTSGSSFFNWCFKRIKRKDYFGTLQLPVYAKALVTISIRKIGGIAKCGMCALGPVDEFGPTLLGMGLEGKDYSSTTFNMDGTSKTTLRPYAKRMTLDVVVDNHQIDYLNAWLFERRQKMLVFFGGGSFGSTIIAGRYGSFKIVIQYQIQSLMSFTIEGAV
ncbi:hypothetical protein ACFOHT_10160 [Massilia oculi]|uniref:Uncharacterized protein n=1 Tax=Massilia oculi TaxID=945844 RepID=A0A2S2DHE7_9BURK|nr:hypothetical protein [Massilia oculi]AWL04286.1 hypothetical protein DIR46_07445 [Massilia oculi]